MRLLTLIYTFAMLTWSAAAMAQRHQVAITIDDLPRGGDGGPRDYQAIAAMTKQLLQPFREQKIPVIGFVNAGRHQLDDKEFRSILDMWLDAGADLGNHSYSHADINSIPLQEYTADILKGEPALRDALQSHGKHLEFYRHPYLHEGSTPEAKQGLRRFLDEHHYRVAPVTLDNSDYMYAALYQKPEYRERVKSEYIPYLESIVAFFEQRALEVTGHDVKQTMLLHASQLNADMMPDLLAMFKRRGYEFVTLSAALKDPAYQLSNDYVGPGGFSWIHRWSMAKGMSNKGEPDPPEWVLKAFDKLDR
jgi:peptidoglycan/xylan/chitin deacetylase (PgdA/CDA1 family)